MEERGRNILSWGNYTIINSKETYVKIFFKKAESFYLVLSIYIRSFQSVYFCLSNYNNSTVQFIGSRAILGNSSFVSSGLIEYNQPILLKCSREWRKKLKEPHLGLFDFPHKAQAEVNLWMRSCHFPSYPWASASFRCISRLLSHQFYACQLKFILGLLIFSCPFYYSYPSINIMQFSISLFQNKLLLYEKYKTNLCF